MLAALLQILKGRGTGPPDPATARRNIDGLATFPGR
jgi:hypothetical protein